MAGQYIGEIRIFAGAFAPAGWAWCDGQLLPISENAALFQLIGTTYGGDGENTFALPDMRGRFPVHAGTGPGLSAHMVGQTGGAEEVTLTRNQMPAHRHVARGSVAAATATTPQGGVWAASSGPAFVPSTGPAPAPLAADALGATGGSQPHENRPPFRVMSFIISLYGIFPSRT
ncbi:phage tail protein [Actinotalea sp. BY-33]|uniref:Phage tail protein n=1 Tax=Actinotalea soli TaxID=2819234 RepID=A0A939LTW1_9CELL|nr:tail fiber protein [Actinotalea soli]MBO1752044.1 phage tail protein [Actinotalea soli]